MLGIKYRSIILAILAFLILVVSILGINVSISYQLEANSERVNIAGRQRMLSQRIAKSIGLLASKLSSGQQVDASLTELEASQGLFDKTLSAFDDGGETESTIGDVIFIDATSTSEGRVAVKNGRFIWNRVNEDISFLTQDTNALNAIASSSKTLSDVAQRLASQESKLVNSLEEMARTARRGSEYSASEGVMSIGNLLQRFVKNVHALQSQFLNNNYQITLEQLNYYSGSLDKKIRALHDDKVLFNSDEEAIILSQNFIQSNLSQIADIYSIWSPIHDDIISINNAFNTSGFIDSLDGLTSLQSYLAGSSNDLLKEMNDLTLAVENEGKKSAGLLRLIQIAGVVTALMLFAFIMYRFLGQLRKSDIVAENAQQETINILNTVDEGLFLIDKDFVIGDQYSSLLSKLFEETNIAGRKFSDFMRSMISEKDLTTAESYLGLLFDKRKKEKLLGDLNPLKRVAIQTTDGKAGFLDKFVKFGFLRVETKHGEIDEVLCTVSDITSEVKLEQELEAAEKRNTQQMEMLSSVLNSNVDMLPIFISNFAKSLEGINNNLRNHSTDPKDLRSKANNIFAKVHTIKGEAASLDLDFVVEACHGFESKIRLIQEKSPLKGKDFLGLTVSLERLIDFNSSLNELMGQLSAIGLDQSNLNVGDIKDYRVNWNHLYDYADAVAQRHGKKVDVLMMGLNDNQLNQNFMGAINTISTQMIRNSIAHGIEKPKYRTAQNKSHTGKIVISMTRFRDGGYRLTYFDDGAGIDTDSLETKAVKQGIIVEEDLQAMTQSQKIALIFHPKLSVSSEVDKDKGQGVGMYAVKKVINELNGVISIANNVSKGVRFTINFPEECNIIPKDEITHYSRKQKEKSAHQKPAEIWT